MLICFARSRALGRTAAELGLQLHQIGENVGLTPQLVGDHRRGARNRRDHGNPHAAALPRFDPRTEISGAGKQPDLISVLGHLHCADREFDAHVALQPAATVAIVEFFCWFRDDGKAVVVEPIDQGPDGGKLLILADCGEVKRAHQGSMALEFLEKALVVDVEAERLGGRVEIGALDKERDLVPASWHKSALLHRWRHLTIQNETAITSLSTLTVSARTRRLNPGGFFFVPRKRPQHGRALKAVLLRAMPGRPSMVLIVS